MIVPKKPFWMRRATYLQHLVDTFSDEIPDIFHKCYSPAVAILTISLCFNLALAYPDRNKLQEIIDKYSEVLLDAQRRIKEKEGAK